MSALALQLELLTGRYVATAYNDRSSAEWPPHPARLFSALVEAWASGEPGSAEGEEEKMALVWLERQPAPSIAASATTEVGHRSEATVFVPVNDIAVIRAPDSAREKLEEAEQAAMAGDAKAAKSVEKLRKKLADDTAKAIAVAAKSSDSDLKASVQLLPDQRTKQARSFPSVTPAEDRVTFVWMDDPPEARLRVALGRLASRLTRLGHSSSMVAARLVASAPAPRYVPDVEGDLILRAVGAGQVERLIKAHHQHQGVESRVLPCTFVRYREGERRTGDEQAHSAFSDEWIVLARSDGPRLPSTSAAGVAHQLRRALFDGHKDPMSPRLSGHRTDGQKQDSAHLAVVPLPDVGHRHAHGGILGIALVVPRGLGEAERKQLLRALGALEQRYRDKHKTDEDEPLLELLLGGAGELVLERVVWGEHKNKGLREGTWCRASRTWGTATPIALDRNPGDLHDPDPEKRAKAFQTAELLVAESARHIGLPRPALVEVSRSCVLPGTVKPREFPRFPISREKPQRVLVHARVAFEEPVRGPVLLGAGRHLGLGLCRPLDGEEGTR